LGHQTFMTLKETDDDKKIDKQWEILKTKIMQPNLALIFSQVLAAVASGCSFSAVAAELGARLW
jgi:hypothetical protein